MKNAALHMLGVTGGFMAAVMIMSQREIDIYAMVDRFNETLRVSATVVAASAPILTTWLTVRFGGKTPAA